MYLRNWPFCFFFHDIVAVSRLVTLLKLLIFLHDTHIVFISQVQTHVFFSSKLNVYCGGWDTADLAWNKSYKASQNVHVPRRTVFTPSVVMWGAMTWATRVWLIWSWISFLSTRVVSQHDLYLMLPMCMCTKRQSNGWSLQ